MGGYIRKWLTELESSVEAGAQGAYETYKEYVYNYIQY